MRKATFISRPTTRFERGMLALLILLVPMGGTLTAWLPGGTGFIFYFLALMGVVALIKNPITLVRTAFHPVFLAAYVFLLGGSIMESMHDYSDYTVLRRTGEMFFGGMIMATYCRDARAMRTAYYSFVGMSLWMAVYLILNVFGFLSAASAIDMGSASLVRSMAFEDTWLQANLNGMASFVAIGTALTLGLWVASAKQRRRNWLLGATAFCFVGAFLPMSRSGILMVVVLCGLVLFVRGIFRMRTLVAGVLAAIVLLFAVPDVVWSRMSFSTKPSEGSGRVEGRVEVLLAVVESIPEASWTGVGSGNYWGRWGMWSSFYSEFSGGIAGAHNAYFQILLYWGVFPLMLWIFAIWQAYRCIPQPFGRDLLALFLLLLFCWMVFDTMFSHNFYAKSFALVLGILVGYDLRVRPLRRKRAALEPVPGNAMTSSSLGTGVRKKRS